MKKVSYLGPGLAQPVLNWYIFKGCNTLFSFLPPELMMIKSLREEFAPLGANLFL